MILKNPQDKKRIPMGFFFYIVELKLSHFLSLLNSSLFCFLSSNVFVFSSIIDSNFVNNSFLASICFSGIEIDSNNDLISDPLLKSDISDSSLESSEESTSVDSSISSSKYSDSVKSFFLQQ